MNITSIIEILLCVFYNDRTVEIAKDAYILALRM